jgi:hypothetical protein
LSISAESQEERSLKIPGEQWNGVPKPTRVRLTSAMGLTSFLIRGAVRATPLSEMALWKRFLAKGDNTWQRRREEES